MDLQTGGLRHLSLFTGAGLGELAKRILGWRTVCYVERDEYCQGILRARIDDGILCDAPIWDDVRTFDGTPWRGRVDVISGGYPCQRFSTATRGRSAADDLWPDMLRIVREVRPRFVFAENVLRHPIERSATDLCALGYVSKFGILAASELGAPHRRPRWWLVADSNSKSELGRTEHGEVASVRELATVDIWQDEPTPLGVDDGSAHRMDRLRALGNGQVPIVAATAWRLLGGPG